LHIGALAAAVLAPQAAWEHAQTEFWITDAPFAAACDGVTPDDVAFAAAVAAAGAVGGKVKIPLCTTYLQKPLAAGPYTSTTIEGSDKLGSGIEFGSGGISSTSVKFEMRDLTVTCGPSSTCVALGSATSGPTESTVERVKFAGGGVELSISNGSAMHVQNNSFFQCVYYCIAIQAPANVDGGDSWVTGNFLLNYGSMAGTAVGIYQISGGGWKIQQNKVNQFSISYYLQAQLNGAVMSNVMIQQNSLEGCSSVCVLFTIEGIGAVYNVNVDGNEGGAGLGGYFLETQPLASGGLWIGNFGAVGNKIRGVNAGGGIYLSGLVTLNVTGNIVTDAGTCGVGITTAAANSTGLVDSNTVTQCSTKTSIAGTAVIAVNNGP
jgi:hypothetical protein